MKTLIVNSGVMAAIVFSAAWLACGQEDERPQIDEQQVAQQRDAEQDSALRAYVEAVNQPWLAQKMDDYFDRDSLLRDRGYSTGGSGEAEPPVIIQFSPAKPDSIALMAEDLAVMTRLIEKALNSSLGEPKAEEKMGVKMLFTGGGRSVGAIYLEGTGPLFMMKVNFPLAAPPKVEAKPEPATTSEWEAARKELRGFPRGSTGRIRKTPGAEYKEEQVEALKKALLTVLKQAANIRQLKPDDFVAVSVFGSDGMEGVVLERLFDKPAARGSESPAAGTATGQAPFGKELDSTQESAVKRQEWKTAVDGNEVTKPSAGRVAPRSVGGSFTTGSAGGSFTTGDALTAFDSRGGQPFVRSALPVWRYSGTGWGTVLTIRARKSDVDTFAKGELNLETFQARATINTYIGTGPTAGNLSAWSRR